MQAIYKSVLALKIYQAVFRSHSSGALPVLAITGFRFCCKTNEKPYVFAPLRVQKQVPFWTLWESPSGAPLGTSGGASLGALLGLCGGFCESSLGHILGQAR